MPDITDHPQYDAVAMNEHGAYRGRILAATEEIIAFLLRAYDRAHSADKAAP